MCVWVRLCVSESEKGRECVCIFSRPFLLFWWVGLSLIYTHVRESVCEWFFFCAGVCVCVCIVMQANKFNKIVHSTSELDKKPFRLPKPVHVSSTFHECFFVKLFNTKCLPLYLLSLSLTLSKSSAPSSTTFLSTKMEAAVWLVINEAFKQKLLSKVFFAKLKYVCR